MLVPMPGFSYIKTLAPPPPPGPERDPTPPSAIPLGEVDDALHAEIRLRMRIILDVLFRVRPLHHLDRAGLSPLCAKLLRHHILQRPLPPGPVRLNRTYVRQAVDGPDLEVYGSCTSADRSYAFLASFGLPAELSGEVTPAAQDPAFWQVRTVRVL